MGLITRVIASPSIYNNCPNWNAREYNPTLANVQYFAITSRSDMEDIQLPAIAGNIGMEYFKHFNKAAQEKVYVSNFSLVK